MNHRDLASARRAGPCVRCAAAACLLAVASLTTGCTWTLAANPGMALGDAPLAIRLHRLGPADMLLLGEQHDAPEHQRLHLDIVNSLLESHELTAVVLEMADVGHDTRTLNAEATEPQVQAALGWRPNAWPWERYGPAIMAAVGRNIPVLGGNLPRQRNTEVMRQPEWEARVSADVLARQQQAVRAGHCDLLPEGQIGPMTRIQLARDVQLAATMLAATVPGRTVVLLTGSQHADKTVGVPLHLPRHLRVKTIRFAADGARPDDATAFDAVWPTAPVPPRDHCAELTGHHPRP